MVSRNGQNNGDGSFDWKDAVIDAAIISGSTFFTTIGGSGLVGVSTIDSIKVAGIAAAAEFFAWLTIKRGLREKQSSV
jgi:hypothetical protein